MLLNKGINLLVFLTALLLLKQIECVYTNASSIQDVVYRVSAEKMVTEAPTALGKKSQKKARLVSIVRGILLDEFKSLENSITDSVMEELINYYGAKLDTALNLSNEMIRIQEKVEAVNQTVQKLEKNQVNIEKSHESLVNKVRNSISNAKRLREKYLRLKFTSALKKKTLRNMEDSDRPETTTQPLEVAVRPLSLKFKLGDDNVENSESVAKLNVEKESDDLDLGELAAEPMVPKGSVYFLICFLFSFLIFLRFFSKKDCQDLSNNGFTKNGVYKVFTSQSNKSFDVYCEFENTIGKKLRLKKAL